MVKLYYSPGACSMAPHVILNETGQKVELVKIDLHAGEGQKPEFLKINPRGQVPVIEDDGQVITEGAAIIIHILEKAKSPLLPASGKERTTALQWLCFANASMHPAYGKAFWANGKVFSTQTAKDEALHSAFQQINKLWAYVDAQLAKTPYVAGKNITAGDILLTVIANWSANFPTHITLGSNVQRLIKEVSSRPSYQKAMADEKVEYKVAA